MVDYDRASTELIRALRGKRSQAALNRRLGYRSNAVYTWENGRCHPSMSKFLTLLERVQRDPEKWWLDFARWQRPNGASHATNTAAFMEHLRGNLKVAELARHTGRSRYALMRWLGGKAEPTLPQFLEYVEATTRRVLDLVALLVDPAELPSLAFDWRKLRAARDVAYESPWTHAVLRCLELEDYARLAAHEPGWLARRLGISPELEVECLDRLAQAGQIKRRARRWAIGKATTIDTRSDRERDRELRAFWAKIGAERATNARLLGYNLFAVSRADENRIVELTRNYFEAVRTVVSGSAPSERVLLLNLSLLPFEARE